MLLFRTPFNLGSSLNQDKMSRTRSKNINFTSNNCTNVPLLKQGKVQQNAKDMVPHSNRP